MVADLRVNKLRVKDGSSEIFWERIVWEDLFFIIIIFLVHGELVVTENQKKMSSMVKQNTEKDM